MAEYIFYKISCIDKNVDYSYIGSTQNFRCRKNQHKSAVTNEASNKYNITLYKTIREYGGWENWCMSPIGKGIFEKRVDALIEEQKYITNIKSTLNVNKAFISKEEMVNYKKQYNEIHKKLINEKQIKYNETHKEEIKEANKKYREEHKEKTTCECGGCYTYAHKTDHFKSKRHINYFS